MFTLHKGALSPCALLLGAFVAVTSVPLLNAGVTVVQNVAPAATSWPSTPLFSTVSNPSTQLTVPEGYSGASSYTQTFTAVGNNYTLDSIAIYAGGGSGTSASATLTLNLYDLGAQTAPNPNSYAAGFNMLGNGSGLPVAYTPQSNGVLRFDFNGDDRVYLTAGHLYAFEIAGVTGTTPMLWVRNVANTYTGGAAYRNRNWINGNNARDFGLAVYGAVNPNPPPPSSSVLNSSTTYQQIDGFGAGAVFLDSGVILNDTHMDALYLKGENQMGLNLIRLRIAPTEGGWTEAINYGRLASARGVRILASPWTPPAAMKTNNSTILGSLLPSEYGNYVNWLNRFTDTMRSNGAPVFVVSLQNEPDWDPDYEGCLWTAEEFRVFCRDFAGGITTPLMMPESLAFIQSMSNPTLNDPAAAVNVDYVGGHLYGATIQDYPLAHSLGKHTWMTEFLINDQSIESAISTAQQVHDCLAVGNMSAYIWWKTIDDDNGLLTSAGVLQRRAYVMAQFAKFVLPGYVRVGVTANSSPLGISAYRSMDGSRYSVVAVNNTAAAVTHRFKLQGVNPASVTPVVTTATQSLEVQTPVAVSGSEFLYTVPTRSIVTFTLDTPAPISVTKGGFVFNRRTNRMVQNITVKNTSAATVNGPVRVALDGLSSGTSLLNATGVTAYTPSGNPFVTVSAGALAPGASATIALEFAPTSTGITYAPRVIYGTATP